MMEAPGKGMLKAASILFIVFGGIAGLFALLTLIGSATISSIFFGYGARIASGILVILSALLIVICAVEVIVGILGLKKCGDPLQYNYFIIAGIIFCVFAGLNLLSGVRLGSLVGLVAPVLYVVGGNQNKNARRTGR